MAFETGTNMEPKLLIVIPTHNRREIAEECIPTVEAGIRWNHDLLVVYDDGSTDDQVPRLTFTNWELKLVRPSVGIEAQRRMHFYDFWDRNQRGAGFTHLYLTDADALHDPNWRSELLRIQEKYGDFPVCGYNTQAHVRLVNNTIEDKPESEVIWRRVAPGISYLLTAEHVAKVVRALPALPAYWHWDWTVPSVLGNRFAVTRKCYVDHVGRHGLHHPESEGWDGGDRALNPTEWLVAKRAAVVGKLRT